jgi:putative transposase
VTTPHATPVLSFAPAVGKPYEGEPHVRFDEGAVETGRWSARPGHSPERGETARGRRTWTVPRHCPTLQGRNLDALVPKARQAYVRAMLRRAYRASSAAAARRQLTARATWLARNGQADAAASLREGLEETLTVLKLGLPPGLRRFFATTNCIENLIGTLRHVTRNIKRWRDGDMRRRWIGLGLLRAAERFRRIKRHSELGALVTALGAVMASE